jgi:hypothetical protein
VFWVDMMSESSQNGFLRGFIFEGGKFLGIVVEIEIFHFETSDVTSWVFGERTCVGWLLPVEEGVVLGKSPVKLHAKVVNNTRIIMIAIFIISSKLIYKDYSLYIIGISHQTKQMIDQSSIE